MGLHIWHCPSHGADPLCPGHQGLVCLDRIVQRLAMTTAGERHSPTLPNGLRWMGCRQCARGPPSPHPSLRSAEGLGSRPGEKQGFLAGGAESWDAVRKGEPVKMVGVPSQKLPYPLHPHPSWSRLNRETGRGLQNSVGNASKAGIIKVTHLRGPS